MDVEAVVSFVFFDFFCKDIEIDLLKMDSLPILKWQLFELLLKLNARKYPQDFYWRPEGLVGLKSDHVPDSIFLGEGFSSFDGL